MKTSWQSVGVLALLLAYCMPVSAQEVWSDQQQGVLDAIEELSSATAPDGSGADGYAHVLAEDFSRWTVGASQLVGKEPWVESLREWFDEGWRVTEREQTIVEVSVMGDYAFTRRIVDETYLGPQGESSESRAALVETWVQAEGKWLLLRVNVQVLPSS